MKKRKRKKFIVNAFRKLINEKIKSIGVSPLNVHIVRHDVEFGHIMQIEFKGKNVHEVIDVGIVRSKNPRVFIFKLDGAEKT